MQMIGSNKMGYDRGVTIFSPDGRLFQVQYAMEAVKRGATVVGVVSKESVVLAVDKRVTSDLIIPESVEKIFRIDEHIGAATSGLVADGRKLVDEARIEAQRNRMIYGEKITTPSLVKHVADVAQIFTQYGGLRPFGVSLLIGGVDDEPRLFETDPSGTPTEWKAAALGEGRDEAMEALKKYKDGMSEKDAIKLALTAISNSMKKKMDTDRVEVAVVKVNGLKKIEDGELKNFVDEVNKSKVKKSDGKS